MGHYAMYEEMREECERLREENARLTRERDEARAEVARLEGLEAEAHRIRAQPALQPAVRLKR